MIDSVEADEAATPIIKLEVETIASSDPSTAARNQAARPLLWVSRCRDLRRLMVGYLILKPRAPPAPSGLGRAVDSLVELIDRLLNSRA